MTSCSSPFVCEGAITNYLLFFIIYLEGNLHGGLGSRPVKITTNMMVWEHKSTHQATPLF